MVLELLNGPNTSGIHCPPLSFGYGSASLTKRSAIPSFHTIQQRFQCRFQDYTLKIQIYPYSCRKT